MAATRCLAGVLLLALVASGQQLGVDDTKEPLSMVESLQQIHPFMGQLMKTSFPCQFCEEVIDFLLNVTTSKETLDGIEQLLLTLCDWAPFALHKECSSFAKQVPGMIEAFAKEYLNGTEDCAPICNLGGDDSTPDVMNFVELMKSVKKKRPYY